MSVTKEELDQFHRFAAEAILGSKSGISWNELLTNWQSVRERSDVNDSIRKGLADVAAGRHRPAADVMENIRKDFGFTN